MSIPTTQGSCSPWTKQPISRRAEAEIYTNLCRTERKGKRNSEWDQRRNRGEMGALTREHHQTCLTPWVPPHSQHCLACNGAHRSLPANSSCWGWLGQQRKGPNPTRPNLAHKPNPASHVASHEAGLASRAGTFTNPNRKGADRKIWC